MPRNETELAGSIKSEKRERGRERERAAICATFAATFSIRTFYYRIRCHTIWCLFNVMRSWSPRARVWQLEIHAENHRKALMIWSAITNNFRWTQLAEPSPFAWYGYYRQASACMRASMLTTHKAPHSHWHTCRARCPMHIWSTLKMANWETALVPVLIFWPKRASGIGCTRFVVSELRGHVRIECKRQVAITGIVSGRRGADIRAVYQWIWTDE